MCGEVPAGFKKVQVFLRLGQNQTLLNQTLGTQIPHVHEVWLDEFSVRNPNGGGVNPDIMLLKFEGQLQNDITGANGDQGHPLYIDNASLTHVVYQRPRLVCAKHILSMQQITISVKNIDGTTPTFDDMNISLTFVCRDGTWTHTKAVANDRFFSMARFAYDGEAPEPQNRQPPGQFLKGL